MRILFPIFLILFILPVVAHEGVTPQQNKIQGIWNTDSTGDRMILTLNEDGSGETIVYNFKLQDNSLTISGGDLDEPVKFSRNNSNVQEGK